MHWCKDNWSFIHTLAFAITHVSSQCITMARDPVSQTIRVCCISSSVSSAVQILYGLIRYRIWRVVSICTQRSKFTNLAHNSLLCMLGHTHNLHIYCKCSCDMIKDAFCYYFLFLLVGIHPTSAETLTTLHVTRSSGADFQQSGCWG